MLISTDLWDAVRNIPVPLNVSLYEVVNLRSASSGWLYSGYNIVRNSTSFEVFLKIQIPKSNNRLQAPDPDNYNDMIHIKWYLQGVTHITLINIYSNKFNHFFSIVFFFLFL